MNGKGSDPRPLSVPQQTFADNWARTFGTPAEKPPVEAPQERMPLNFTGRATLILDLADHEPVDLRFTDRDLVLQLLQIILDHMDEPFEVLAAEASDHAAQRQLLGHTKG